MLTQWHVPPPLTSTVKLSLFTHVHSSPLSLAARLHQCHANHSCYINDGWVFSRQTVYQTASIFWTFPLSLQCYLSTAVVSGHQTSSVHLWEADLCSLVRNRFWRSLLRKPEAAFPVYTETQEYPLFTVLCDNICFSNIPTEMQWVWHSRCQ